MLSMLEQVKSVNKWVLTLPTQASMDLLLTEVGQLEKRVVKGVAGELQGRSNST